MSKFVKFCKMGAEKLLDWVYPEDIKCFGCGKDLKVKNIYNICADCKPNFPLNDGRGCVKCGGYVFGGSQYCTMCKGRERSFEKARAPLAYRGLVKRIIRRFKYDGEKFYCRYFARIIADEYAKSDFDVDVVVPVPMTDKRVKERGYNHAELIAREFCKIMDLPLDAETLIRLHDTESQTRKNASERRRNLEGAFKLTTKNAFKDKNVLLIDDVMTTGATAHECAKTLRAKKVFVLTVAHTKMRLTAIASPSAVENKVYIRKHTLV